MVFNKLKHFNKWESWGRPEKMNGAILFLMDEITNRVKDYAWKKYKKISPCIIHCGYSDGTGHTNNSRHYSGNAVDFHYKNIKPIEVYYIIIETLKNLQMLQHTGLGIYPDWKDQGFHLDIRDPEDWIPDRWARIDGQYVGINKGLELWEKTKDNI